MGPLGGSRSGRLFKGSNRLTHTGRVRYACSPLHLDFFEISRESWRSLLSGGKGDHTGFSGN